MKILLDTNVLIAAFVGRGVCADLLEHCVEQHEVFTSEFILDEFAKKLVGKFKTEPEETKAATTSFGHVYQLLAMRPSAPRSVATRMTTTFWRPLFPPTVTA